MASIPLPALDVKTAQQPDLLEKFGQLQQLRASQQQLQMQQQEAPLRMQQLQQGAEQGQIGLQQAQQGQQDQQAFRAIMQDPSMHGKTIGDAADALASQGKISPAAYTAAKKADLETRTSLATLDEKTLANQKAAHTATQDLYNNVMNLPDDQLAANWPQIAQQYDAIPGNNKQPLNPNQPLTKQQLAQFAPVISMGNTYFDQELARREAQTKAKTDQAELELKQQTLSRGGATDVDKFESDWLKSNNLQDTPQNRVKAFQEYTKETKIAPAEVRAATYLQMPQAVADPNNPGGTVFVTRQNAIGKEGPNSGDVKSVQATQKYFTSGKGAQQLTAFNTAMQHLDVLDKLGADLNNSNIQLFNKASQAYAEQTGNPAPANFAAAKNAMAGEVGAALKASGATDQEISKVDSTFSRAQSPMQLKGAIATYRVLLRSKAANLKQQYDSGMQGKPNFDGGNAPTTQADPLGIR